MLRNLSPLPCESVSFNRARSTPPPPRHCEQSPFPRRKDGKREARRRDWTGEEHYSDDNHIAATSPRNPVFDMRSDSE